MPTSAEFNSLSDKLITLHDDHITQIVSSLANNNYTEGTVQYAILKGFEYWKNYGHISCLNALHMTRDCSLNEYYASAISAMMISANLFNQFKNFVDEVLTWVESHQGQLITSPSMAIERAWDVIEEIYDIYVAYVPDVRNNYNKMSYEASGGPSEKTNITTAKNIFNSVVSFGYAKCKTNYSAAISVINTLSASIASDTGFPNENSLTFNYSKQYDLKANENKINTLSGTSTTGLSRTIAGLESSMTSHNLSNDVILLNYSQILSNVDKLDRCYNITYNILDQYQDNIGYNPKKYADDNIGKVYVIGMQLYDSKEYILINGYITISTSLMDECIDRLAVCRSLIAYSEQIRMNSVNSGLNTSLTQLNAQLSNLNSLVSSVNDNVASLSNELSKTKTTLSSLITAHNKGLQLEVIESLNDEVIIDPLDEINIDDYIQIIRTGIYGKDIRDAIANALDSLQIKTNKQHLNGINCTYADWVSAGKPNDKYNVYFVYDENMIIYRGIKYRFNTETINTVGEVSSINSGAEWHIFGNEHGYGVSNFDTYDAYSPDPPPLTMDG